MARLLVNPGTPEAWEIPLPPGTYRIGRVEDNDFQIPHPSVSGSHCELVVDGQGVFLRDLDSSNGTFVDRNRVSEVWLQAGQYVQLGTVEMLFETADGPTATTAAAPRAPIRVPLSPPLTVHKETTPVPPAGEMDTEDETAVLQSPEPLVLGVAYCKFHPRMTAKFKCEKCNRFYCDSCVTTRKTATSAGKFCRVCGTACVPVETRGLRPEKPRSFFLQLPGTAKYPFRGSGPLILTLMAVVFAGIDFVLNEFLKIFYGSVILSIPLMVAQCAVLGYLYSFMQLIIHSTAAGEGELPQLPATDGLLSSFFRLLGTVLLSFGLMFALAYFAIEKEAPWAGVAMIPALIFGCAYFPMAFLAVAINDNVFSANPLVVIPAIIRIPREYAVTSLLLAGIFLFDWLGGLLMAHAKTAGFQTRSMVVLLATLGLRVVWSFVSLYLLIVMMRILGLLYLTKKDKLNWF